MGTEKSTVNVNPSVASKIPYACLVRIQSVYGGLKSAERRAVDRILERPNRVADISIVEFAAEAGCSEATVVRLAKRLGYGGFPELKRDFARASDDQSVSIPQEAEESAYADIDKGDDPVTVFEKVVQATITALNDTVNIMPSDEYERVVDVITDAGRLLFVGIGDAGIVALEARQRFLRAGKRADSSPDPDTQLMLASQLRPGDVVFAISHSGRSRTVLDTVKEAKAAGAYVVAITNTPISPLAKRSDFTLLTAVFTRYMTVEVISKRVTELCVIESLLVNFMNRAGSDAIESIRKSEKAVEVNKI